MKRRNREKPKKQVMPLAPGRAIYEWLCIVLLLTASTLGPILFGAVRLWSFGGLALIVSVGCLLTLGLALRTEKGNWIVSPPGGVVALIFLAYLFVRIPFSPITYEARIEFLKIASLVAAYWCWMLLLDRPGRWRILSSILILVGAGICLYAFIQQTHDSIRVLNIVEVEGRRARGTYVCPNHLAAYLEILLCFSIGLLLNKSSGWPLRIFAIYGIISYIPAIFLTQSRSGWIGTFVGVSVVLLLWCWRKSTKWFLAMLGVIPIAIVALSIFAYNSSEMVQKRINNMILPADSEKGIAFNIYNSRLEIWQDTVEMIKDKPAFGHGGGSYRYVIPQYLRMVIPRFLRYAHNDYLHHTAEYGIVGLLLFAAIIVVGALKYLKWIKRTDRDKNACMAIGLTGAVAATLAHCFFDYNLQYYSNNHVLVLVAAITASTFFASGDFKPKALPRPKLVCIPAMLAVLALIVVWTFTLVSYGYTLRGKEEQDDLEFLKAEKDFKTALRYDPGNWKAHMALGQVFKSRGTWEMDADVKAELLGKAIADYKEAMKGNPYEVGPRYGISQVLFLEDKTEEALAMQKEVAETVPGFIFYKIRYGLNLRKAGRYEEALKIFNSARRLNPGESQLRTINLNLKLLRRKLK